MLVSFQDDVDEIAFPSGSFHRLAIGPTSIESMFRCGGLTYQSMHPHARLVAVLPRR